MHFPKLAIVSSLAALVVAQDIGRGDVPRECTAICAPLATLSKTCDDTTNDDVAELNCICSAANANTIIPTCDACVAQFDVPDRDNDKDDKDDKNDKTPDMHDVREVLTRCNFTTTTFNAASASAALGSALPSGGPNRPAPLPGTVVTTTSGTVVFTTSIAAPTPTRGPGATGNAGGAGSAGVAGVAGGAGGAGGPADQRGNAAPAQTVGAFIGLGALGFALGML